MLFPHLLNRKSFVTELGELDKFFLNLLESFLPVAVRGVGFSSLLASKPILFIQVLNVSDFRPKTRNLFPKNFKMIHGGQDNASVSWGRWRATEVHSFTCDIVVPYDWVGETSPTTRELLLWAVPDCQTAPRGPGDCRGENTRSRTPGRSPPQVAKSTYPALQ